ncbi:hypothetical protein EGC78_05860 [Shewanella frigidimarina]|nr:hypothetical protein EGC78_05860 [Shewanella frigidimarina]
MATFSLFENVAGRLGVLRGNSRWFPLSLVWAKRHDVSGRRPYLKKVFGPCRVEPCDVNLVWAKRHDVSGRRPLLKRMNIKYSLIINHTHHSKMPAKSLAFIVESFNVCE